MPHTNTASRRHAAGALLILLLACVCLTACGGSSGGTSSSTNASASSSTSTGTSSTGSAASAPGRGGPARFAAVRECLQKNGVTLPQRKPGQRRPGAGGGFLGAGAASGRPQLPSGVTRAKYEAAIKKCGGARFGNNGGPGARRANSPAFRTALTKFAACLRQNGINVPAPNTSGKGPIFSTKGINTASSQFKSAETKCRSALVGAFGHPGAGRPPGAGAGGAASAGESSG